MIETHGGQPWRQQYFFNTSENKDNIEWVKVGNLPEPLYDSQAVVTKNRIYLLGGDNGYHPVDTVYTASIGDDGTIGSWSKSYPLPITLTQSKAVVVKNRVYLMNGSNWTNEVSIAFMASIEEDGSIGKWKECNGTPLPVFDSEVIAIKNRIYVLGGVINDTSSNKVYMTTVKEDGTLDDWAEGDPLPGPLSCSQFAIVKNRVYLLSGDSGWNNPTPNVYVANINNDGTLGKWMVDNPLPNALLSAQVVTTNSKIYLLGGTGYNNDNEEDIPTDSIHVANIDKYGGLGGWTIKGTLPKPLHSFQVVTTKNYIYLLGGYGSEEYSDIYRASFNGGLNDYSNYYSN